MTKAIISIRKIVKAFLLSTHVAIVQNAVIVQQLACIDTSITLVTDSRN